MALAQPAAVALTRNRDRMQSASATCPACRRPLGRRSRRRNVIEAALAVVEVYPFRCLGCAHRFLTFRPGVRFTLHRARRRALDRVPVAIPCEVTWADARTSGSIAELTMYGASVETDAVLVPGMEVGVVLRRPGGRAPITVEKAVVRWTRPGRVGLGFVAIAADESARLRRVLRAARGYSPELARLRRVGRRPSSRGGVPWLLLTVVTAVFVVMLGISLLPLLRG